MNTTHAHQDGTGRAATGISNPQTAHAAAPHPEAECADTTLPPEREPDRAADRAADAPRPIPLIVRAITGQPELGLRQSSVVTAAVMLRVVGYDQLRRLVYPGLHSSIVRKDVAAAVRTGLLRRWSYSVAGYGRIGQVHPTERANDAVLTAMRMTADAFPWGKTVRLMIRSTARRALTLDAVPKWFAHQREVNHLVTSIVTSARAPVWASSWQEPFPSPVGAFTMPQPDYVLVEMNGGEPRLVFGEHDRGHELVERFVERKVALYTRLAAQCEEILGVRSFRVDVSVIDVVARQPVRRLRRLLDATKAYGAGDLFRFTLGGWLYANPHRCPWFHDAPPASESHRLADHVWTDATQAVMGPEGE